MTKPKLTHKEIYEQLGQLHKVSITWDELGRFLAKRHGRSMPYTGRALMKAFKGERKCDKTLAVLIFELRK